MPRYPSAPNNVCLAITKRCNLRCKHCCVEVETDPNELTLKEVFDILTQLKEMKVFSIQIFGGEPFVRKDVFDILRRIKEMKFGMSMNTNCTLITDEIVEEIKKLMPIGISTSIDGSNAKIHDELRGEGAFAKLLKGVEKFKKAGIRLNAEAVITKHNIRDLPNIAKTAKEIGLSHLRLVPIFNGGQAKCYAHDLTPGEEEYKIGREIYNELVDKYPGYADGAFHQVFELVDKFKKMKRKKYQRARKLFACGAARMMAAIRSDGIVTPCNAMWDVEAGSLRETTFKDIWDNSPVMWKFRNVKKVSLDTIPECRECEYKYFCTGNCRASAFYSSGDVYGFTPDCRFATATQEKET